jgi:hypothetical protein
MIRRTAVAALCAIAWLTPGAALAEVERFAVVIGNNHGLGSDGALQYAESDASRVFDVLRELGNFKPANMVLLRGEDAATVQQTLISVNDRIRAALSLPDAQAMLFVYYSGHADADNLHLGATRLPITQLAQLARGSAANFRLVVLDACRSGALTRVKGGKIRAPFDIAERVPEEGLAFLTASAADEDAQESDELRSSFFTHALVSGLLGAADRDRNGEVAIDEAYRYAYEGTIRATSRTFSGTQHPAFRYDFRGQGSVVLTRPEAYAGQRASLQFPVGYGFLLMRDTPDGPVIAEIEEYTPQRALSLRPGRYFVRARGRAVMYEGPLSAAAGSTHTLTLAELNRIEYARLVRKGSQGEVSLAQAIEVGSQVRSVLPNAETLCIGAFVGYALDFASFGARARFGACHSGFDNPLVESASNAYDLDLRLARTWDFARVALELGLGGGLSLFTQSFRTLGRAPHRQTLAPFLAIGAGALFDLAWHGVYLRVDLAVETHFISLRTDALSVPERTGHFALRSALGFGTHY